MESEPKYLKLTVEEAQKVQVIIKAFKTVLGLLDGVNNYTEGEELNNIEDKLIKFVGNYPGEYEQTMKDRKALEEGLMQAAPNKPKYRKTFLSAFDKKHPLPEGFLH
jgi:hypothetical protein